MIKWSMSPSSSHTNGWKVWSDMERSLEAATLWNHFRFMPKPRQLAKGRTKISEKCDKVFFFAHFRSGFPPCMWNITFIYIFACCCFFNVPEFQKNYGSASNPTTQKLHKSPNANRGHYFPNPTNAIIPRGTPSKLPCLLVPNPPKWLPFNDPKPNHPSILYKKSKWPTVFSKPPPK